MTVRYLSGDRIRRPDQVREGDVWSSKGLRFEGGQWVPYRKRSNHFDNDWTPAEDESLRAYFAAVYDGTDKRELKEFAAELGRTPSSCHARAGKKLGITQERSVKGGFCTTPKWTEDEHAILDEWYPKVPIAEVARMLPGRSKASVFTRANVRGLVSPYAQQYRGWTASDRRALRVAYKRGIAIADVAFAVGRNPLTVSKYATNHGLDFGRRPLLAESPSLDLILSLEDDKVPMPRLLNAVAMRPSKVARRRSVETNDREICRREREKMADRRRQRREERKEERRRQAREAREQAVAARAAERQRALEARRIEREQEKGVRKAATPAGEQRSRATSIANARRSQVARAAARKKAENILEAGGHLGHVRNPGVKIAYQALVREREQERRKTDPVEQAKLTLQRRYAPVCSMAIYGGKQSLYMVGHRKDVSEQELLSMAEKLAA